jgi:hypothetical protein
MSMPRHLSMMALAAALALPFVSGCDSASGGGTTPTVDPDKGGNVHAPTEGAPDDRSMGALRRRLEQFRAKKSSIMSASVSDPAVCEELCSLASDICDVKEKLCDLADERPDDEQYQGLCREAKNECQEAQESCVRCVEANK